jgi:hypothetical protein
VSTEVTGKQPPNKRRPRLTPAVKQQRALAKAQKAVNRRLGRGVRQEQKVARQQAAAARRFRALAKKQAKINRRMAQALRPRRPRAGDDPLNFKPRKPRIKKPKRPPKPRKPRQPRPGRLDRIGASNSMFAAWLLRTFKRHLKSALRERKMDGRNHGFTRSGRGGRTGFGGMR